MSLSDAKTLYRNPVHYQNKGRGIRITRKGRNIPSSPYEKTAIVIEKALRHGKSFEKFLPNKNKEGLVHKLASLTIQHMQKIDYLLEKFNILAHHPGLEKSKARAMIAELLWNRRKITSMYEPLKDISSWKEELREAMLEAAVVLDNDEKNDSEFFFPTYVRINTLSISIEMSLHAFDIEGWNLLPRCNSYSEFLQEVENLSGRNFVRDYHISELLVFPRKTSFYDHPGYLKGKFLLQDKGSCLSSFLLNPKPGSIVLDLCAAPGLKTNHLANIMNDTGRIYANDHHERRLNAMNKLLDLTNVSCVDPKNNDVMNLKIENSEDVQYILVDPTCTNSGMLTEFGGTVERNEAIPNEYKLFHMLRYALLNFPNVKRVVYTTNSLFPEEGELVVDRMMKVLGDTYTLLDTKEMLWNEWERSGLPDTYCGSKCLRTYPDLDYCYGQFIAVFERNFDVPLENLKMTNLVSKKAENLNEDRKLQKPTIL